MGVREKDITKMHAQPPTLISKAEAAKDGEGKMAARTIAKAVGAAKDLAARDLAARERVREKARAKGAKHYMSAI